MSSPIAGHATSEGTAAYAANRGSSLAPAGGVLLGETGLSVSGTGFGCYRVHVSSARHRRAFLHALRSGINLIDASANYGDGGAEELVGEVLRELIASGELTREQIVVVTKGGYIQGQNMEVATEREAAERPFPEVVEVSPDCWHCIHPEFLADQITRSLDRMQLECADVYLLHNPEYYLEHAQNNEFPLERARKEYYRRIREAFAHLETEVERGRIASYGISSNSFPNPAAHPVATSLERCWEIAESISASHHFRVVQLPVNLFEQGAWREGNQESGTKTVLEYAREKGLGALVNRPLNAFTHHRLIRLADPPANLDSRREEIRKMARAIAELEGEVQAGGLGLALALNQALGEINTETEWHRELSQHLIPFARHALGQAAGAMPDREAFSRWQERMIGALNSALEAMGEYFAQAGRPRLDSLHEALIPVVPPELAPAPLAQKAIWILRSLPGVSCVLVGMRREEYVEDCLAACRVEPGTITRENSESWAGKLHAM